MFDISWWKCFVVSVCFCTYNQSACTADFYSDSPISIIQLFHLLFQFFQLINLTCATSVTNEKWLSYHKWNYFLKISEIFFLSDYRIQFWAVQIKLLLSYHCFLQFLHLVGLAELICSQQTLNRYSYIWDSAASHSNPAGGGVEPVSWFINCR